MRVNDRFREEMKRIEANPNALKALCHPGFYDELSNLNTALDMVQKSLNQFLEKQRQKFPRFYFLSNDDLLVILGHSRNPELIQPHIKKLFEGIKRLEMSETIKKAEGDRGRGQKVWIVQGLLAPDDETVKLDTKVAAEGAVENWLDQIEYQMQTTLKKMLVECYKKCSHNKDRVQEWINSWPG